MLIFLFLKVFVFVPGCFRQIIFFCPRPGKNLSQVAPFHTTGLLSFLEEYIAMRNSKSYIVGFSADSVLKLSIEIDIFIKFPQNETFFAFVDNLFCSMLLKKKKTAAKKRLFWKTFSSKKFAALKK